MNEAFGAKDHLTSRNAVTFLESGSSNDGKIRHIMFDWSITKSLETQTWVCDCKLTPILQLSDWHVGCSLILFRLYICIYWYCITITLVLLNQFPQKAIHHIFTRRCAYRVAVSSPSKGWCSWSEWSGLWRLPRFRDFAKWCLGLRSFAKGEGSSGDLFCLLAYCKAYNDSRSIYPVFIHVYSYIYICIYV